MMFNLSHVAEFIGWRPDFRKDFVESETFQEVYDEPNLTLFSQHSSLATAQSISFY
jgi:hypothetical protein